MLTGSINVLSSLFAVVDNQASLEDKFSFLNVIELLTCLNKYLLTKKEDSYKNDQEKLRELFCNKILVNKAFDLGPPTLLKLTIKVAEQGFTFPLLAVFEWVEPEKIRACQDFIFSFISTKDCINEAEKIIIRQLPAFFANFEHLSPKIQIQRLEKAIQLAMQGEALYLNGLLDLQMENEPAFKNLIIDLLKTHSFTSDNMHGLLKDSVHLAINTDQPLLLSELHLNPIFLDMLLKYFEAGISDRSHFDSVLRFAGIGLLLGFPLLMLQLLRSEKIKLDLESEILIIAVDMEEESAIFPQELSLRTILGLYIHAPHAMSTVSQEFLEYVTKNPIIDHSKNISMPITTPLLWAIVTGNKQFMLNYLQENKSNVKNALEVLNDIPTNALWWAIELQRPDIALMLIAFGVNIAIINSSRSIFYNALDRNQENVVRKLFDYGIIIKKEDLIDEENDEMPPPIVCLKPPIIGMLLDNLATIDPPIVRSLPFYNRPEGLDDLSVGQSLTYLGNKPYLIDPNYIKKIYDKIGKEDDSSAEDEPQDMPYCSDVITKVHQQLFRDYAKFRLTMIFLLANKLLPELYPQILAYIFPYKTLRTLAENKESYRSKVLPMWEHQRKTGTLIEYKKVPEGALKRKCASAKN